MKNNQDVPKKLTPPKELDNNRTASISKQSKQDAKDVLKVIKKTPNFGGSEIAEKLKKIQAQEDTKKISSDKDLLESLKIVFHAKPHFAELNSLISKLIKNIDKLNSIYSVISNSFITIEKTKTPTKADNEKKIKKDNK